MRILLVADYFGLDRATGAKRANAFAKYWAREPGVSVDVLTARKSAFPRNPPGAVSFPDNVREIRVSWPDLLLAWEGLCSVFARRSAAPAVDTAGVGAGNGSDGGGGGKTALWKRPLRFASDLLTVPDRNTMWLCSGIPRGLATPRPDVVVGTAPSFVNLVIARAVARLKRVPFVADMRDPWATNPFQPARSGALKRWNLWHERRTLRDADEMWVTTGRMAEEMVERLPLRITPHLVTNGYDEEEWAPFVRTRGVDGDIRIVHTGTFYGVRSPIPFLEDLNAIQGELGEEVCRRIRVLLIGPVAPELKARSEAIAEGLAGMQVRFLPPVGFADALQHQLDADLLLLVGHKTEEPTTQVPLKLYEYLRAGGRQLAYFQKASAVADMARDHPGLGIELLDLDRPEERRPLLAALLARVAESPDRLPAERARPYERREIAVGALERLRALVARHAQKKRGGV